MKKSLFAVAALSAIAGAAQAQSSVTVYGILDVGYSNTSTRNAATKQNTSLFDQSRETSSRLGFKGTEDLGGGTSAFFTAEFGLTPQSTTASSMDNRQTFVGLAKKGLGKTSLGTQYTVLHDQVSATDPGGSNNVVGSIIRPAGSSTNQESGQYNASTAEVVASTNNLKFNTEKFAGFGLNAMYVQNGKNATQTATNTGGTTNYSGWGVTGDYSWKKLYATVAYQSFKQEQTSSATAAIPTSWSTDNTVSTSSNTTDNGFYGAATYDFGILKAYANYISRKITSNVDSSQYLKRSGQQIGVRSYITPTIEGWASIGTGRYSAYGANKPTANFNAWQLGSNYYLSKRTNLYGIYGQSLTSSTTNTVGGAAASQFAVGVRHTF
ncbi:porin [Polynucleobacter sp. UK-Mo-2m-Kol15]|uniref:porin n=1 Tax=Polynucleobacter sp. UK-Mo-2m-Kol15 TaxID=2576916 RepID=UPI001C0DC2A2|nr:porin [Polynucleobacter sp. UK-Mo-2m-Kol15]MBU3574571.1 porin [Polynucleobacter sp. UK-Mo-2m-Kol15]